MLELIKQNWKLIVGCLIVVTTTVVSSIITVKKSGGKTTFWEALKARIFEQIPQWAELVEKPGNGEEKKEAVLELALNEAKAYIGRELSAEEINAIRLLASSHLENVLKAPKAKNKKSKYTTK